MRFAPLSAIIVAVCLGTVFHATPVQAQVPVFVAQTGLDENPCTFSAPCRTFQHAHDVSFSGGVIEVLDATDYGPLTISRAISILGHGLGEIVVPNGNVGVVLSAAATDVIAIDGVNIIGTASNTAGVAVNAGLLTLSNSTIRSVGNGVVVFQTKADLIHDNIIGSSSVAIKAIGPGADQGASPPLTGQTLIRINGGNVIGNATALQMLNPGTATGGCNRISIWFFTDASNWSTNVAGNTTILSVTGTGTVGMPCGPGQYQNAAAPF